MADITLTEPTIKKEKQKGADGKEHPVLCVCVFVENDSNVPVKGDISFWHTAPGAVTPIGGVICTKKDVTILAKKVVAHGSAKGREEVCCCADEAIAEVFNSRGHIMAAWGKRDDKGVVTIGKAEETKQTKEPIKIP
jgi:hypothetical protein